MALSDGIDFAGTFVFVYQTPQISIELRDYICIFSRLSLPWSHVCLDGDTQPFTLHHFRLPCVTLSAERELNFLPIFQA